MVGFGVTLGVVWLLGAVAPSPTVTIEGGTPAQRAMLQKALDRIPSCWRSPNGKPLHLYITDQLIRHWGKPDEIGVNAEYVQLNDGRQPADGSFHTPPEGDYVWVMPGIMPVLTGQQTFGPHCKPEIKMDSYEMLVHELGHRVQLTNGKKAVDGFLAIRYKKLADKVKNDPEYKSGMQDYEHALNAGDQAAMCAAVAKIDKAFHKHRMVTRWDSDSHALDNDGSEYFAMAIEMLATHPDSFCANFSQAEQSYLTDHFGGCLSKMKNIASCVGHSVAPAPGAPSGGDGNGGAWLQR